MCKKYHQKTGRTDHLRPSNSDFDPSLGLRIEVIVDFSCQCCVPFCFLRFKGRKGPKRATIPYEVGSWTNESPKCEGGGGSIKLDFGTILTNVHGMRPYLRYKNLCRMCFKNKIASSF